MLATAHRRRHRADSSLRRPSWLRSLVMAAVLVNAVGCARGAAEAPAEDTPLLEAEHAVAAGVRAHRRHEYHIAIAWFDKALARYRSIDDARGIVVSSIDLADTLLLIGEHQRAQRLLTEAKTLVAQNALDGFDAHLALLEADARVQNGDDTGARAALEPLLAGTASDGGVDAERGKADVAARMLAADIAVRHDPAEAHRSLAALEAEVIAAQDPTTLGRYRRLQAELHRREGRPEAAASAYRQALVEYRRAYYRPGIAATHERLAQLYVAQQHWQKAAPHLETALHIRLWISDRVHSLEDMQQLALAEEQLGNTERARALADWQRFLGGDNEIPWQILRARVGGD